jgi:hypothetical protein
MNYKEQQAMVEKLKTTWTAFGGLSKEEQEFLKENKKDVGQIDDIGLLGFIGHFRVGLHPGMVYRLKKDFQLPAPAIEAPAGYRIVSMEDKKRCKYPVDCDIKYTVCGRHGWIPPLYRNWRNDETDGFSRHYAVPSNYTFAEDRPKFVEYPIFDDYGWSCSVEHLRKRDESVLYSLHELPSIVGFAGVKFADIGFDDSWFGCPSWIKPNGQPATPIAARFYINGETK